MPSPSMVGSVDQEGRKHPSSDWHSAARDLVRAASLAPSGDNMQPWTFVVDDERLAIEIHVDRDRDTSPMNAGQRMARIAVGAAVENVLRTAAKSELTAVAEGMDKQEAVAIRISNIGDKNLQCDDAVRNRCTNRRLYDKRPIAISIVEDLKRSTPASGSVRTHWITGPDRMMRLAALMRRSDALMFGATQLRNAFFANVRFDVPTDCVVEEGLSLDSLEVLGAERIAFRLLARMPGWLAALLRVGEVIGKKSEKLVRSASGVCLVDAPDDEPATDFAVGQAMERAWLAITERGLSAQPMMSFAVLDGIAHQGTIDQRRSLEGPARALLGELRELFPELGQNRPAFLLRFGSCPPPSGRTGRRGTSTLVAESVNPSRGL